MGVVVQLVYPMNNRYTYFICIMSYVSVVTENLIWTLREFSYQFGKIISLLVRSSILFHFSSLHCKSFHIQVKIMYSMVCFKPRISSTTRKVKLLHFKIVSLLNPEMGLVVLHEILFYYFLVSFFSSASNIIHIWGNTRWNNNSSWMHGKKSKMKKKKKIRYNIEMHPFSCLVYFNFFTFLLYPYKT